MAERVSALAGQIEPGRFGDLSQGQPGVTLSVVENLSLQQVAAWPDSAAEVAALAAAQIGLAADVAPAPCRAVSGGGGVALLRVEPLKWWLTGENVEAPALTAEQGATLDLSHSRTQVRIDGPQAAALLNRHVPLDLRPTACPADAVASTAVHHVGVTLWRSGADRFELFLPRGFALSLWQLLLESAAQFGAEVK